MDFLVINSIIFVLVFILLIILSWIWPPDSPWAPWWRTNRQTARAICRLAKISKKDVVYDLGCGDGTLIITAAKEYGAKAVGIEIDPLRFWISKFRVWFNGLVEKVGVKQENFFNSNLSEATVIVVYLVPKALNQLLPKFKKELKKGTKVVSFRYQFNLKAIKEDKIHNLFLYKI